MHSAAILYVSVLINRKSKKDDIDRADSGDSVTVTYHLMNRTARLVVGGSGEGKLASEPPSILPVLFTIIIIIIIAFASSRINIGKYLGSRNYKVPSTPSYQGKYINSGEAH